MKSLICSLVFILIVSFSYGQWPITQNLGSASTLVQVPANGGLRGNLINRSYSDTTSANLGNSDYYEGAMIYTTSDSSVWYRIPNKWIQLLPSGSVNTDTSYWSMSGNYVADRVAQPVLGTTTATELPFITNDTTRLTIPIFGIPRTSSSAYKYLMFDTTSGGNFYLGYGDGGSASAGWELTGNAGTTAGTNFIGTTDAVDLVFKRNNVVSGKLQTSTTSFGVNSLFNGGTNDGNSAFGAGTLYDNLTGDHNTAIGENSLSQITGDNNIGLGAYSGFYPGSYSNRLFINSLDRATVAGDTTESIIYGVQDANPLNQTLYFNSQVFTPYLKKGAVSQDELIGRISSTGQQAYVVVGSGLTLANDTLTASGSGGTVTGSGTTNYLPKWSSSTALGNSLTYDNGTDIGIGTTVPQAKFNVIGSIKNNGESVNDDVNTFKLNQKIVFYGSSVEVASDIATRWTTTVANTLGCTEVNKAINSTPFMPGLGVDSAFFNRLYTVPTYDSSYRFIFIGASNFINDDFYGGNYANLPQYINRAIDTLTMTRLWPLSKIILVSSNVTGTATYNDVKQFCDTAIFTANAKGVNTIDVFTLMQLFRNVNNSAVLKSDSTHPTAIGHALMAKFNNSELGALTVTNGVNIFGNTNIGGKLTVNQVPNYTGELINLKSNDTSYLNYNLLNSRLTIGNSLKGASSDMAIFSTNENRVRMYSGGGSTDWMGLFSTGGAYGSAYGEIGFLYKNTSTQHASLNVDTRAGVAPFRFFVNASGASAVDAMDIFRTGNIGIGTNNTDGGSKLSVQGSFATAYRAITALRTLDATDHTINCTANTFTVTLPTAASISGRQYTIVNSGAGVITIGTTSSQTFTNINGTPTTLTLDAVAASAVTSYTVVSNGANWIVVSKVINP